MTAGKVLDLDPLFHPKGVAVLGASQSLTKTGAMILLSIVSGRFRGKVYPINPREKEILGVTAYSDLRKVPGDIDLAIICVPAASVSQAVKECAEVGVKFGLVISSGFGEVSEEGKAAEKDLIRIASRGGMRLIGPNSMGMVSSDVSLYVLMNVLLPMAGSVSVVSQSGTLGSLAMVFGSEQSVGFSKFVSSGNEADLHTEDFIEYLAHDPQTRVILSFVEGVGDGGRFLKVAREATKSKPLVMLKGGISEAGAKAASSHTGSMAGSPGVYDALFRQAGIIQARSDKDLVDLVKAFSLLPPAKGRKVGIVTGWGGTGVLASDACAREGLEVPELPDGIMEELNQFLPPFWSHRNPVDITGAGIYGDFATLLLKSIEVLLGNENIDAIICTVPAFGSLFERVIPRMDPSVAQNLYKTSLASVIPLERGMAEEIIKLREKYKKPIVGILIGFLGHKESESIKLLEDNGVPVYESPFQAAHALSELALYREYRAVA